MSQCSPYRQYRILHIEAILIQKKIIQIHNEDTLIISPYRSIGINHDYLLKRIDYINLHFKESIRMNELCDLCNITKQHMCLLFRTSLHTRPMEYITKKRLQYSKELLSNSTRTIEDIAYECGFCTPSYFCKMFKRYEGISPTQFRRTISD